MTGLKIETISLTADAASRILETALDAGHKYGFGYWADCVHISYSDCHVWPQCGDDCNHTATAATRRVEHIALVQHEDAGKYDQRIAGENNGVRSPLHDNRQYLNVNSENLRRGILKMLQIGHGARLLSDDLDGPLAEEIIQFACFGELVYG